MPRPISPTAINLGTLRWHLALLLLALLITVVMAGAAFRVAQANAADYQRALATQAQTRAHLARASDDEREIRSKIDRYQEIIRSGRTQPEKRLDWIEAMKRIQQGRRLTEFEYEIAPQRALDDKQPTTGGYAFLASPMKLEMTLLHEGDLLGLLNDLRDSQSALTSVRHCRIERRRDETARHTGGLLARCELDWITLQEKL